jgi:hypothetical protein
VCTRQLADAGAGDDVTEAFFGAVGDLLGV